MAKSSLTKAQIVARLDQKITREAAEAAKARTAAEDPKTPPKVAARALRCAQFFERKEAETRIERGRQALARDGLGVSR